MADQSKKTDILSETIGDIGRFQATRIAFLFLISIPGLAHVFCLVFGLVKVDSWCADGVRSNKTINKCVEGCEVYDYDRSFWRQTIIMEYDLVCARDYLLGKSH